MSTSTVSQSVAVPLKKTTGERTAPQWLAPALGAGALLAIFCWLFSHFLASQFRFAIYQQADWGHTLVIPFIAGYFVWLNRHRIVAGGLRTTWLGLLPVVLGIAVYLVCTMGPVTLRHHNLKGAGAAFTITGLVLLFCGWKAMRWLWFPLAYLFVFGQTISESLINRVTYFMQDITARGAGVVLSLFLDVDRLGNTLYIWDNGVSKPLNIAEACSGMRMLMAFLALGVAMAYTGFRPMGRERSFQDWYRWMGGPARSDLPSVGQLISLMFCAMSSSVLFAAYEGLRNWQRVLLVLMAVPTAIFVNILRVCTLGGLSLIDSGLAAGDFHSFVGLVWLLPAFLIFLGLMWMIRHSVIEAPAAAHAATTVAISRPASSSPSTSRAARTPFDRRAFPALIVACVTLLVCGIGFQSAVAALNIYLRKERVEARDNFASIPRTLGRWRTVGEDATYEAAMIETLGTNNYLDRHYAIDGEPARGLLSVHLAYYTGMIDAVPHIPERCFLTAGFEQQSRSEVVPLSVDRSAWTTDPGPANSATGKLYMLALREDPFTGVLSRVRMPVDDLELTVMQFARNDWRNVNIFGGYLFIANGRATARPEAVRLLAFKPSERYAYYCKLQFVYYAPGATREQYIQLVSSFLQSSLPEIMLCLPDWQQIERKVDSTQQGSAAGSKP